MLSSGKSAQGKHGKGEGEAKLGVDAVKLLKTQDAGYLRTVGQKGRRELEELNKEAVMQNAVGTKDGETGRKIVFLENGVSEEMKNGETLVEDVQGRKEGSDEEDGEDDELSTQMTDKGLTRKELLAARDALAKARHERKRRKRLGEVRAAKLNALKKRQKEIMAAAEQLDLQRAKMAKTIGGVNRDGVRFKIRERKR